MHTIKVRKNVITRPALIGLIAGCLKKGGVAVLPTDTIYGFSCLADNEVAIKKIKKIKKREGSKPFIILVKNLAMLRRYAYVSPGQASFLKKTWKSGTKPTTVILRHKGKLPAELTGESDGLAVRLPKSDFLIKILTKVNSPLVSTSLNISGKQNLSEASEYLQHFGSRKLFPDLVIDSGKSRRKKPSRLIDLRKGPNPIIIRK